MRLGGRRNAQAHILAVLQIPQARFTKHCGGNHRLILVGAGYLHDIATAIERFGVPALSHLHHDLARARRNLKITNEYILAVQRRHLKHAAGAHGVAKHHLVAMYIQALVMRPCARQWPVGFLVQPTHADGVLPFTSRTAPTGTHGIGECLVAANGGVRVVTTIHRDATPVDEAAAPTHRAVEQIGIVEHERISLGDPAFALVQPNGNSLVYNSRPAHLQ